MRSDSSSRLQDLAVASRWLQELSLYLMLLLLPFAKAAVEIASVLLLIGWVIDRINPLTRRDSLWFAQPFRPLTLWVAAFFLACAASVTTSTYPLLSLNGLFWKWGQYLSMMIIIADLTRQRRVAFLSLAMVAASAVPVVFEGLWQERYQHGFFKGYRLDFFGRMTGPYQNPIDLATYLMVIIPMLLAFLRRRPAAVRAALFALVLVLLGCLGRTQAFGAWLGLCLALVIVSLGSGSRLLRVLGAAAVLIGLGAWLWFGASATAHDATSPLQIGRADRLAMWQAAMDMVRDRPVLGLGLNTFMANYLKYWVGGERQPRYAHNCYLQMAAETGLIGLAAFLGLLLQMGWVMVRGVIRITDQDQRLCLLGCLAGLLAFAAQSAIDTNFYALRQAALFWTVAGLAIGLAARSSPSV